MEANAIKIKITPPGDVPVHDDIYSRALIVRNETTTVCLINFDLLHIDKETTAEICRLVEERTGILSSNIMIAGTHNHNARISPPPLTVSDGKDGYKRIDSGCLDSMIAPVVDGVVAAHKNLLPARIGISSGRFSTPMVVNDRYLLNDKTIAWDPDAYTEDEIISPTGPVDPEVRVLHVKDAGEKTIAVLYNYACHANAFDNEMLGNARSADYPGVASDFIENKLGGIALFTAGASGDIHPFGGWWSDRKNPEKRHQAVYAMGEGLGATVEGVIRRMNDYRDHVHLSGAKRVVSLSMRQPGQREEADIIRTMSRENLKKKLGFTLARCRYVTRQATANPGKRIEGIIQVLRIGDLALAGIPGELFVEYGLEIKKRSCAPLTNIVTLANDNIGYLFTDTAFQLAGYQTWPILFEAYPAPSAGRILVEESLMLIADATGT